MKIPLLLPCILFTIVANTQSLKKYPIGNSGCSLYSYCESKYNIVEFSEDSSKLYRGDCLSGDVTYGTICIKLLNPIADLVAAEDMVVSYLDYLKSSFSITQAAGYGKGHRLNNNENTRGIIDYWEDKEKDKWKIKAWTDGNYIGFMYAYSKKELPEPKVNIFLDSFRLPGMK